MTLIVLLCSTTVAGDLTTLALLAAQLDDQGEYVCRATLDGTTLMSPFYLEVRSELCSVGIAMYNDCIIATSIPKVSNRNQHRLQCVNSIF